MLTRGSWGRALSFRNKFSSWRYVRRKGIRERNLGAQERGLNKYFHEQRELWWMLMMSCWVGRRSLVSFGKWQNQCSGLGNLVWGTRISPALMRLICSWWRKTGFSTACTWMFKGEMPWDGSPDGQLIGAGKGQFPLHPNCWMCGPAVPPFCTGSGTHLTLQWTSSAL